jgi:carbon storage regulator
VQPKGSEQFALLKNMHFEQLSRGLITLSILNLVQQPMLVLSRQQDEAVRIGDEVIVKILSVKGKQVRIGIEAPSDVSVHREEIYVRIQNGGNTAQEQPTPSDQSLLGSRTNSSLG